MSALSKIDMREVTRLTRAGRLAEAMALLRGRSAPGPASPRSEPAAPATAGATRPRSPIIDMTAPPNAEGAWRAPGQPAADRGPEAVPSPRATVPGRARFEARNFSNDVGSRAYKVYAPSAYVGQALPVVVMLHGCSQDPDDFAAGTQMNALAEAQTFLVAYPAQPQSANLQKCWNWFNSRDQQREGGEPSLIAGITRQVIAEFSADARRVYIAGLSAGGAAAAIMAATYPDLFAAAGVHSGLACGAASDMASAFAAMAGRGTAGRQSKGLARGAPLVPTIVFHGDADRTVSPVNGDRIVAQAQPAAPLTCVVTRGRTPGGVSYTRKVQHDPDGRTMLEQWILHGAGHAWAGGSATGSYTDPKGPDASREMMRFFLEHKRDHF